MKIYPNIDHSDYNLQSASETNPCKIFGQTKKFFFYLSDYKLKKSVENADILIAFSCFVPI